MMLSIADVEAAFAEAGGRFLSPARTIRGKLRNVRAYLFDWDGVFNEGVKGAAPSPFSEASSMGLNLLRFGHWLAHEGELPFVAIVTGQENEAAFQFAKRERLDAVYFKFSDKRAALAHIEEERGIPAEAIAFAFDDALDLSAAGLCGVRALVRRPASPLFERYAEERGLADYLTAHTGGQHAVREICELYSGLSGRFAEVMDKRVGWHEDYQAYFAQRQAQSPRFFRFQDGQVNLSEGV